MYQTVDVDLLENDEEAMSMASKSFSNTTTMLLTLHQHRTEGRPKIIEKSKSI